MEKKSQISNLLSGAQVQVLNPNKDYSKCARQSNEGQHAGSSYKEREALWQVVTAENQDGMTIEILGMTLTLQRRVSLSGKTVVYVADLEREQASQILGDFLPQATKYQRFPLVICEIGVRVEISKRSSITICPSLVTII